MGAFDTLMAGQVREGFWGAHTASIDWASCETNYASSLYIAEFINTLSNIPFIALGLYGAWRTWRTGAPARYAATMAGLAGIGMGSAGFHATLKWEWQMMDELPMIFVLMHSTFLILDTKPGFEMGWSWLGLISVWAFDIFITVSYFCLNNPVYHQICFATIQILSTGRVIYLISQLPPGSTHPARPLILRHVLWGLAIFIAGFAVWNVDNVFCMQLRRARDALVAMGGWGRVAAWTLQGHAWWHLATGYGSYLVITGATYLCLIHKSTIDAYELRGHWLPYVSKKRSPRRRISEKAKDPQGLGNGSINSIKQSESDGSDSQ